jgi:RNA polymerase sigma factor (sigma-70 family)
MATTAPEIPVLARNQAFESLYRRYVKEVYHYAFALLRNPADAEDVTQTTFLNAYRAYQRGIEIEKPQNWLIKIAHNVARTRYARASRRVKEVPLEDHVEQLALPEADRPDVTAVLRALGRLPFNQRAALVMRELEGRSYAEIADTIGVSVSAVETLIFRGRRSLRLKASSLRALVVVPLPSSLTPLVEGGGIAAGGGAAFGTGFLVKAAVALVAGVVATGVSGDRNGPSVAAAGSTPRPASGESSHPVDGVAGAISVSRRIVEQHGVQARSETTRTGTNAPAGLTIGGAVSGPPAHADAGPASAATASTIPVPALPSPVSAVTDAVQAAVPTVSTPLPVQAPSLPPVPVDVPKVPGVIPLP